MLYDLAVLGGGAAGLRVACAARNAGLAVAIFEKDSIGGNCLHNSYFMMDTLLNSAKSRQRIHKGHADATSLMVDQLSMTTHHNLNTRGIDVIPLAGELEGKRSDFFTIKTNEEHFHAGKLMLTFGSVPAIPRLPNIDLAIQAGFVFTNNELLSRPFLPRNLVIYGGNIKGLQLAYYAKLCGVDVTVIMKENRIAYTLDSSISELLKLALQEIGINFIYGARLLGVERGIVHYSIAEGAFMHETEGLLLGNIRWPATRGSGIRSIELTLQNGAIATDILGTTNVPNVYAAGDCTAMSLSVKSAHKNADLAAKAILGHRSRPKGFNIVPPEIFKACQAGSVGDTMQSAVINKLRPVEIKLPLPYDMYSNGLIKLIGDKNSGRLIGAHIIGLEAKDLLNRFEHDINIGTRVENVNIDEYSISSEIAKEALYRLYVQM